MSVIVPDDPGTPLCTTDGKNHEWHVICAYCGMPGYHDERSEEIAAWDRLKAEAEALRVAVESIRRLCTEEPDAVSAATRAADIAGKVLQGPPDLAGSGAANG